MSPSNNIIHFSKKFIPLLSDLPLVNYLIHQAENCSLDEICIIGGQHLLQTTHLMFQSLYELGLNPNNIFLIGKCYSSNSSVFSQMLKDGINVSKSSVLFSCYQPFDKYYQSEVGKFYKKIIKLVNKRKPKKIIVLDDGGYFLTQVDPNDFDCKQVIGIEQTTSGYDKLTHHVLKFPIINVARSWAKLKYESPIISEFAIQKFLKLLPTCHHWEQVLIMGGGAIGLAIKEKLKHEACVDVFDTVDERSSIKSLNEKIPFYDLIIGCTGSTSIPHILHDALKEKCILASVSSSDREFDAHYLRRKTSAYTDCHQNISIEGKLLLNSGFPINFDGGMHSVPPKYIQLTRALLVAAIFQSIQYDFSKSATILDLCPKYQNQIVSMFINDILSKEEKMNFYQMPNKEFYRYA